MLMQDTRQTAAEEQVALQNDMDQRLQQEQVGRPVCGIKLPHPVSIATEAVMHGVPCRGAMLMSRHCSVL